MGTACLGCCEYNNIFSKKTQGFTKRQIYFLRFFSYPTAEKKKANRILLRFASAEISPVFAAKDNRITQEL